MIWIKFLKKIVAILHSDISPRQIAAGFALGAFLGLPPSNIVNNLVVFFVIMILNVNVAAAFLGAAVFALISFALDPLSDVVGYALLAKMDFLTPFWVKIYNAPLTPFTRFYNTVMLGSFATASAFFVPTIIVIEKFIIFYRARLKSKVENLKIMKAFKATNFFSVYDKLKE
ncbi:MAG: TIGR03546 family protein [Endomicrobiia bacterium]|nr:TIGR03546 family protein [Endomicrobiia bacterium]